MTTDEHFGLTGPVHASEARVVLTDADEERSSPRSRRARGSSPPRTCSGRRAAGSTSAASGTTAACRCSSTARSPPARSRSTRRRSTSTPSPRRSGCARRSRQVRSTCATRSGSGCARPAYLAQSSYEPTGAFVPKEGAARFDSGWIGAPTLAGLVAALDTHPEWRYERAAEAAARCRELLAERGRGGDAAAATRRSSRSARRRPDRARRVAARARRDRPRAARTEPRPRVVRLVDERGRPRSASPTASRQAGRARTRSAAAPRRPCGCGRRGRRPAPRRPCRRPRGGRRPRTTAA